MTAIFIFEMILIFLNSSSRFIFFEHRKFPTIFLWLPCYANSFTPIKYKNYFVQKKEKKLDNSDKQFIQNWKFNYIYYNRMSGPSVHHTSCIGSQPIYQIKKS